MVISNYQLRRNIRSLLLASLRFYSVSVKAGWDSEETGGVPEGKSHSSPSIISLGNEDLTPLCIKQLRTTPVASRVVYRTTLELIIWALEANQYSWCFINSF